MEGGEWGEERGEGQATADWLLPLSLTWQHLVENGQPHSEAQSKLGHLRHCQHHASLQQSPMPSTHPTPPQPRPPHSAPTTSTPLHSPSFPPILISVSTNEDMSTLSSSGAMGMRWARSRR